MLFLICSLYQCTPKRSLRALGLNQEMGADLWLICLGVCSQWNRVMYLRNESGKIAQAWCHKFLGNKVLHWINIFKALAVFSDVLLCCSVRLSVLLAF